MQITTIGNFLIFLTIVSAQPCWSTAVCSGYIDVKNAQTLADLGFLKNTWSAYGHYGALTPDSTNRLVVNLSSTTAPFSLYATTGRITHTLTWAERWAS